MDSLKRRLMDVAIAGTLLVLLLQNLVDASVTAAEKPNSGPDEEKHAKVLQGKMSVIEETGLSDSYIRDIRDRFSGGRFRPTTEPMQGEQYVWDVYVPANDVAEPPGICVYISPSGASKSVAEKWKGMMDQRNLIYIGSRNSGNQIHPHYRMALTLHAATLVKEKYKINPKRVYVCGDSGGGRVSSLVACLYPDVFTGAIYSIGCDFWNHMKDPNGGGYWQGFLAPATKSDVIPPRIDELTKNRFVFLTGDRDGNMPQTKATYRHYLNAGINGCAYIQVEGMDHRSPPMDYWHVAFAYLDGKSLEEAGKEYEKSMRNAYREDAGQRLASATKDETK